MRYLHIKKSFKNLHSMAKEIANQVGYSYPWMTSASCTSLSKWINTSVPFQTQWHCWVFWISGTNLDMNPHSWRGKKKSHGVSRCRVCLETLASHSSQRLTTLLEWQLLFLHKQKSFLRVTNIASVRSSQTSLLVSYVHNKTTCSVLWEKNTGSLYTLFRYQTEKEWGAGDMLWDPHGLAMLVYIFRLNWVSQFSHSKL